MKQSALGLAMAAALTGAACIGSIGADESEKPGAAGKAEPPGTTVSGCTTAVAAGAAPTRRLTHLEYDNTVADLLGVDLRLAAAFPADQTVLGFNNNVSGMTVTAVLAEQYIAAAEKLANAADAAKLAGCTPASLGEAACAKELAQKLARRAYRRPATAEDIALLLKAFAARSTPTFVAGARLMIQLVLQSPYFLYRVEVGSLPTSDPTVMQLDDHEIASRLSYLLWKTMPDDVLFAAADAGKLRTKEDVALQTRRMIRDPRARAAIADFHRQWLELDSLEDITKDAKVFPEFTGELRADLRTETATFVDEVFWRDGKLETLFTAPFTFTNARLAGVYGLPTPGASGFAKTAVDATKRIGLLGQPAIQALHSIAYESSPIYRGKFVREQILCQPLPPPPEGLNVVPPEVDPSKSTRERYAAHSADPACRSCHSLLDPIGFGFEHFDGIGRYRATEGAHPIDAHGELTGTDVDGKYDGAIELSQRLGKSETVASCVVQHWFRFAHGRGETDADACALETLRKNFSGAKHDMRELVVALTQTDAFRFRKGGSK